MADILVVDDEGFIRTTIGAVLRRAGHTVRQAADGAECLSLFSERHPDLLITDIVMPAPEGNELIRMIRRAAASLPILAISGASAPEEFAQQAIAAGATQALVKPFGLNDMLLHVEKLLAKAK
ncbi:MAG: response regulator [Alphaproteobacteria bacterium]|nr:response regulator [Alphaproteobacteria bacterium]